MSDKAEQELQVYCEKIREVKSFTHFFIELGLPQMSKKELTQTLKKAVLNSLKKKYHGDEDAVNALPELNVMMEDFQQRVPSIVQFFKDGAYAPADPNNEAYKEAVLAYSAWGRERTRAGRKVTPAEVALQHDMVVLKGASSRSEAEENDPLRRME